MGNLLYVEEEQVVIDTLWSFAFLIENNEDRLQLLMETIEVQRIVQLMGHDNERVRLAALRLFGNLSSLSHAEDEIDEFVANGCLPALKNIITSKSADVRLIQDGCWAISNIAAGETAHIQLLISLGITAILIFFINSDKCYPVQSVLSPG